MENSKRSADLPLRCPWSFPEQWLAVIVESSDAAIMGASLDGTVISWNRAATQMFGYTAEEAIGNSVLSLAWPGEEQRMRELLSAVRQGEQIRGLETSRKHKDGKRVHISLNLFPIEDGNGAVIGVAKIARDITGGKQDEEQFTRPHVEGISKEMVDRAPDAVLEVNQDGDIVTANRTTEILFGYRREELLGQPIEQLIAPAHRSKQILGLSVFMTSKRRCSLHCLEVNAQRKDGSEFPIEIALNTSKDDHGTMIVVMRDISERRSAEQQLRSIHESYLKELVARQQESERLNRLKSEFIANVSHTLKAPLHTILGLAGLLREEIHGSLSPAQIRMIEHIQYDSEHLLTTLNNVLDLSRIEAGTVHLHTREIDITHLLREIVDSVRGRAMAKGVALESEWRSNLRILADPTYVRQVLHKLLINAIKFTPDGGAVLIRAIEQEEGIRISVLNNGAGNPPSDLDQIFEKLYQAEIRTGGAKEGIGLDLAICRQLIKMHGGELFINSYPGIGREFSFTLPA
ncbi:PAS domain S-box protein [Terriglobus albidus]|uniref:PAS domain S-box protein n=1 Tax=Terriglobus albidus TaxID=1592106 RepID=UPI0021E0ADC2|nr:PAS domain S-box protein [Terriglobus albidus]